MSFLHQVISPSYSKVLHHLDSGNYEPCTSIVRHPCVTFTLKVHSVKLGALLLPEVPGSNWTFLQQLSTDVKLKDTFVQVVVYIKAKKKNAIITCVLQVLKALEDPKQLCPPSVLQEKEKKKLLFAHKPL